MENKFAIPIHNNMWPGDIPDPDEFSQQDDWEEEPADLEEFDDDNPDVDDLETDNDDDISLSPDEEE